VGSDERIGEDHAIARRYDAGKMLKVHLMHDARRRRNDLKILECFLTPLEELVAFAIALEFLFDVHEQRTIGAEFIDLYRVIDDQIDGDERIDLLRIPAGALHGRAHRGKIDHAGYAGEVLQNDASD